MKERRIEREVSAGGVVFRRTGDGVATFLLIRDSYRHWGLPKGHLEDSESPAQAALRETYEETGLGELVLHGPIRIIDWHFRFQRPQQLALQLAAAGHRVFYVRNTFQRKRRPLVRLLQDRLFEVTLPAPRPVNLYKEALDDTDNIFAGALRTGLANVIPGHTYRIDIETVFQCGILCAGLQETAVQFDNIRLRVKDGTPTFVSASGVPLPLSLPVRVSAPLRTPTFVEAMPALPVDPVRLEGALKPCTVVVSGVD